MTHTEFAATANNTAQIDATITALMSEALVAENVKPYLIKVFYLETAKRINQMHMEIESKQACIRDLAHMQTEESDANSPAEIYEYNAQQYIDYRLPIIRKDVLAKKARVIVDGCFKCGGAGVIEAFRHIDNGRCFACEGSGRN